MKPTSAGYQYRWFHWCADRPVQLRFMECWACGSPRVRYAARGPLCSNCYHRWLRAGFQGPGPGPRSKPPVAESAREYARLITSMSAQQAATRLGVTGRTIVRWRAALREAA